MFEGPGKQETLKMKKYILLLSAAATIIFLIELLPAKQFRPKGSPTENQTTSSALTDNSGVLMPTTQLSMPANEEAATEYNIFAGSGIKSSNSSFPP